jgi:hypothetical protein
MKLRLQVGFPYQYGQRSARWRQRLMFANMALRKPLLAVPWFFSQQVGLAVGAVMRDGAPAKDRNTMYQDALRKGNRTMRNLWALAGLLAVAIGKLGGAWCAG